MKRRIDWYRPAAFLAALLLTATAVADPGSPDAVIEGAVMELTEKLSGRKEELAEDRDALYALINDILLPRFDRKLAAQLVLAKHWRTASDEQRERFINAFYDSLLRKYADGLLEFDEEQIEVIHFRGDTSAKRSLRSRCTTTWSIAGIIGSFSMSRSKASPTSATTELNSIRRFVRPALRR
jgi:phospholipid transport system substrate-binding protein